MTTAPATATASDAMIGKLVADRYRIELKLGAGAMGAVYRATDAQTGGACAVKVLTADAVADVDMRERFQREAKALFGLRHPNILEVRDYGVDGGTGLPYLVMELLQGRTLEDMVVEHTPDPQTGFELAKQVLSGLAMAHGQGVLHRDLKTENVFVVWDGQRWVAKLLDFGLVKFVDDQKWGAARKLTMQGAIFGSPAYMSPEQASGAPTDARSDVYSMGVVLFELLTGSWPFEEENQMLMLKAHLLSPVPPLASKREGLVVQPTLDAIVQKALTKKASDRFANANEMLSALQTVPQPAAWIAGMTHVPPQPLAPAPVPQLVGLEGGAAPAANANTKSLALWIGLGAAALAVVFAAAAVGLLFAMR